MRLIISEAILTENFTNANVKIGQRYDESDVYAYIQRMHRNPDDFWEGDISDRIEKYPTYVAMEVPVGQIQMDEFSIDEDDVEKYVEMYQSKGTYPPLVLGGKSLGKYTIIDGTHRANALAQSGLKSIVCFVGTKK